MSVRIMSLVFENEQLNSTEKLIMLALADHANDEGRSVYPSQDLIARKTAFTRTTVNQHVQSLIDKGYLFDMGRRADRSNVLELAINVSKLRSGRGVKEINTSPDRCKPDEHQVLISPRTGVNEVNTNHQLTIIKPLIKEDMTKPAYERIFDQILLMWSYEGNRGKKAEDKLRQCTPSDNGNGTLIITAPNEDEAEWLRQRAMPILSKQINGFTDYERIEIA